MKRALIQFFGTYLLFVLLFVLQKPVFMLCYHKIFKEASLSDYIDVVWNGLPLDLASAGYLTLIPGLLIIASLWFLPTYIRPAFKVYFGITSVLLSVILVTDIILYDYWGFRLDSTPFFYFLSSPKDAFASSGYLLVVVALLIILALAWIIHLPFAAFIIEKKEEPVNPKNRGKISVALLFLIAMLFIPIRGGFTVSTMNISKAYYSSNMNYNHATINPFFNLMESLMREKNFDQQYRFMSDAEANRVFKELVDNTSSTDTIPTLFTSKRPNVLFIVLESFMSKLMGSLGGIPNVSVHMDKYAEEGILFTNFYANSFRTDRALVSIFSGYPAQPVTSIMKYPKKTQSLPSIPLSLKKAGYYSQYYYGGDVDFTNMRSYLLSMGIDQIISDVDFPLSERLSKWGAHDHILFNRAMKDFKVKQKEPFMKIIQTSSSHEPFQVPYEKFSDPYLNSVAYADSCLGHFIKRFRKTEYWDNTLIVLVPDHGRRYPDDSSDLSFGRFQIPLIFMGGVVAEAKQIDTYASQIDIAATLLNQLGLPHADFTFSKNILNPASPHFAYFSFPNSFGIVDTTNGVIFDCDLNKPVATGGGNANENIIKGKALLQKVYDDLAER